MRRVKHEVKNTINVTSIFLFVKELCHLVSPTCEVEYIKLLTWERVIHLHIHICVGTILLFFSYKMLFVFIFYRVLILNSWEELGYSFGSKDIGTKYICKLIPQYESIWDRSLVAWNKIQVSPNLWFGWAISQWWNHQPLFKCIWQTVT